MSPIPGGISDKFGNRYEGRWTVRQMLYIIRGDAEFIEVEPIGDISEGVEFTLQRGAVTEAHQVKRQLGIADDWDLPNLNSRGVLEAARRHVAVGRQFHFTSIIPARMLDELAERARQTPDVESFINHMLTTGPWATRPGWRSCSTWPAVRPG